MTEKTFSKWLVTKLRAQGWDVQRIETSTGSGVPDINCCKNREEIWIETKCLNTVEAVLRPMQYAWLMRRQKAGGMCIILNLCKKDDCIYMTHICAHTPIKKMTSGIKILKYDRKFKKGEFVL
jgi:Holliday junction resolvase